MLVLPTGHLLEKCQLPGSGMPVVQPGKVYKRSGMIKERSAWLRISKPQGR